ncbi:MAG: ABC transporter substrate-binding protein [Betaproteobacteria bacterium]|nr:ABC transporter substrate-binding protein [Betaproteobacteria bacterium]
MFLKWGGRVMKAWRKVAGALALMAVLQPAIAQDKRVVKIGVIGILAEAGLYIAAERGFFAQEGLQVEFLKDMYGPDGFPALATGQMDAMGGAFGPELINAIARGINVRVVAGLNSYVSGWDSGFLTVRRELIDSGKVRDWKDLRGLKLALAPALPNLTDYFASRYLAQGGLTLKDVTIVNIPFANMIAGLKTGGVDFAHTSEPMSTLTVGAGVAVKWKPVTSYAPVGLTVAMLHFGTSLLDKSPEVGERVLAAYIRGARYYNDSFKRPSGKGEIADILIKYTPVKSRPLYDQIAYSYADPDAAISIDGMQDMASYYARVTGGKPVEARTLVDERYRLAALKRLGPYQK